MPSPTYTRWEGRPVTALNILGYPPDKVPEEVVVEILRGGGDAVQEAGCATVGGHTVRNPEPVYGLAVTGVVHPERLLTKAAARPGDYLVLTKPLGTGIVTTALKRGRVAPEVVERAVRSMTRLNSVGPDLAAAGVVAGHRRHRVRPHRPPRRPLCGERLQR